MMVDSVKANIRMCDVCVYLSKICCLHSPFCRHMLRNLEEVSHIPPERKRKRSVVKSYKAIRIHKDTSSAQRGCASASTQAAKTDGDQKLKQNKNKKQLKQSSSGAEEEAGSGSGDRTGEGEGEGEESLSLLETVQVFHMDHVIQQQNKGQVVHIYTRIYEMLMNGTFTDYDSLAYCIKNLLPTKLIKMLLYKYFPFEIDKGKKGRTLIHLAAEYDFSTVIAMLNVHWEKRYEVIQEYMLNHVSNFAMIKDGHGRTAVHIACEFGSFKSLKVLHQLGCDLFERDKLGNTPLLWCASKDSPNCAFYLIDNGANTADEDRKGRSTLWHAMNSDSILLGKTLLRNDCWMEGDGLQEFVADMSLGREPHKITFDSRTLAECKAYYLNMDDEEEEDATRKIDLTISSRTRHHHHKHSSPRSSRSSPRSVPSPGTDMMDTEEEEEEAGEEVALGRSSRRVVQMSKKVSDDMLAVESAKWSLRSDTHLCCISQCVYILAMWG